MAGPDVQFDIRLAELLSSRLCHDMVGPVGAINNGMELLEDQDLNLGDDAFSLVVKSASQASDLLQFYRLSYGLAGGRMERGRDQIVGLCSNFLRHSKVTLSWLGQDFLEDLPDAGIKLLLNLVVLAEEALPRGGEIQVEFQRRDSGGDLAVRASGIDAGLREDLRAGLDPGAGIDDISPRNVQGYLTRLLARRMGSDLTLEQLQENCLCFRVALPT